MMASLMLFMMVSREKPNIDQRDLAFLEESTDLNDFKGFIRDTSVKQLFVSSINFYNYFLSGYHYEALHSVH